MQANERGEGVDGPQLIEKTRAAVAEVVQQQLKSGIDVINDGEQSKPDYSTYIRARLNGFDGEPERYPTPRDTRDYPEFFADTSQNSSSTTKPSRTGASCTGPISWKDFDAVGDDIARLKAAVKLAGGSPKDVFLTAVSPGQAARFLSNRYYRSHEDYLHALADALKREYDAIAAAGFVLQVDCPDLASGWNTQFANSTLDEFRKYVSLHLAVLDAATADVPPEQLRLHLCWGNYAGPHHHDIPLLDVIDLVLGSRATAFSFEGANPRHEHEWRVFRDVALPDEKIIIPGVIDSTSNFIEHPRAVADSIIRFAQVVGRERVIAGTDCGFSTFAGRPNVHPSLVWPKLQSLVEGARLASAELWA
jgi:5-methyltetrahydropteroyltriglutamate--homocysteine methyltransferase